MHVIKY